MTVEAHCGVSEVHATECVRDNGVNDNALMIDGMPMAAEVGVCDDSDGRDLSCCDLLQRSHNGLVSCASFQLPACFLQV